VSIFNRDIKEEPDPLQRVKDISEKYAQLGKLCSLVAELSTGEVSSHNAHRMMYSGGWRMSTSTLKSAGISMDKVYEGIAILICNKKVELEEELKGV
jgi:1-aminocyclopropane-1-carboxylate deaminase/D-cysteine desulfhydrase-like pyridoxal-dependent ACC family enzyme